MRGPAAVASPSARPVGVAVLALSTALLASTSCAPLPAAAPAFPSASAPTTSPETAARSPTVAAMTTRPVTTPTVAVMTPAIPLETPLLSGSGDARDAILREFLERAPAATCTAEGRGEYDPDVLRQMAEAVAGDTTIGVPVVETDWFVGPRVLAGKALAGGELLALPADDVAWYSSPTRAQATGADASAVMLIGVTLADGRTAWLRSADFFDVYVPPCPTPDHD